MSSGSYFPPPVRGVDIPKLDGKMRSLGIPTVADRIAQMVVMQRLGPKLEPYFHPDSYGYRPGKSAIEAVGKACKRCWQYNWVLDLDIKGFFDDIDHELLMRAVRKHTKCRWVLLYIEQWVSAPVQLVDGQMLQRDKGVPQGGVLSPLLSNIYLNEVDKMLERAKKVTRCDRFTYIEYARFADDLVILVDGFSKWQWLLKAANKRLVEEFEKLDVQMNQEKSRIVDLTRDETFSFLGFDYRRVRTRRGVWGARVTPRMKARTALLRELKEVYRSHQSQPFDRVIRLINPILRGWVNYFRVGNCYSPISKATAPVHDPTAVSVYVLVAIIKKRLKLDVSLSTILQILSVNVFVRSMSLRVLTDEYCKTGTAEYHKQLTLFK